MMPRLTKCIVSGIWLTTMGFATLAVAEGEKIAVNPRSSLTQGQLEEMILRPLFNPTRAGPPPVVEVAPPATAQPDEPAPVDDGANAKDLILLAIVGKEGELSAMIRWNKSGQFYRLKQGQDIQGWTVQSVLPREVILERNGQDLRLALFVAPQKPNGTNAVNDVAPDSNGVNDAAPAK